MVDNHWTESQIEIGKELYLAIERGNLEKVSELCSKNPWLIADHTWIGDPPSTWIEIPAKRGNSAMMEMLIDLGFSVNALSRQEQASALVKAIHFDHIEIARLLLERGADPNLGRPIISALNQRKPVELQLAFVKLLAEYGCDVNKPHRLYGDSSEQFTALDWAKAPEIISFLKSIDAKSVNKLEIDAEDSSVDWRS